VIPPIAPVRLFYPFEKPFSDALRLTRAFVYVIQKRQSDTVFYFPTGQIGFLNRSVRR